MAKKWTPEEEKLLVANVKYDHRGFVCNYRELEKLINRNKKTIYNKVVCMRKKGHLFEVYWDDPINPPAPSYSCIEDKRIISMYKSGCPIAVIAQELNRTEAAITTRMTRLFKDGLLKPIRHRLYTTEDIKLLIAEIKFDENGYVKNADYLANMLNRSKSQLLTKIYELRKKGVINTTPDKSKSSKNWYDAMKKQIDISYQLYVAKQKEPQSSANECGS